MAARSRLLLIGLPMLAVVGLAIGIYAASTTEPRRPTANPSNLPPQKPGANAALTGTGPNVIGAVGLIEAESENVSIGTNLPGVVARVVVSPGDRIGADSALFALDDRDAKSELASRIAQRDVQAAAVRTAAVDLAEKRHLLSIAESVEDPRAIAKEELSTRSYAVQSAAARLAESHARLRDTEAAIALTRTTLERLTVRSPLDGTILQVNVRPGEYAPAGALATPLMVVGRTEKLHVRVDIDEADIPRFQPDKPATLYLRGAADQAIAARFVRVDPYVVPKTALSGAISERVDTRVLRAIYSFEPSGRAAFPGQQVDIFLPARATAEAAQ